MHTDQNYIINKVSEKLTSKIIELENENRIINEKHRMLECKIVELEKINRESTHLDTTLYFDEGEGNPIILNRNVTSLNLVVDCEEITSEIILPEGLLNFKMRCDNDVIGCELGKSISNIVFPNTLVRLSLFNLSFFNQPLDFKSMPNIKEISLELLDEFNYSVDTPNTVEKLTIRGLPKMEELVIVPENIKFVNFEYIKKIRVKNTNSTIENIFSSKLSIKCFSQNEKIIQRIMRCSCNGTSGVYSFTRKIEKWCRSIWGAPNTSYPSGNFPKYITFF
jgi:hypothetical protein